MNAILEGKACVEVDRGPFRDALSAEERATMLAMLQWIHRCCETAGATYFLMYGTLLGAVRHGGFVPWDDDADVAVIGDADSLQSLRTELSRTIYRVGDFWGGMKLYSKESLRADWPFVDIFLYQESGTRHFRCQGDPDDLFAKSMILPVREGLFEGATLHLPNKSEELLRAIYGSDWRTTCQTHTYDHRKEASIEKVHKVPCACLDGAWLPPRMTRLTLSRSPDYLATLGFSIVFVLGLQVNSPKAQATLASLKETASAASVVWMQGFHGMSEWKTAKDLLPEAPVRPPKDLVGAQAYFRDLHIGDETLAGGEQGCSCSHLYMWNYLKDQLKDDEWALVSEDDVVLHRHFREILSSVWPSRPTGANVVNFFNSLPSGHSCLATDSLRWVSPMGSGCVFYAVNREGARYLSAAFSSFAYVPVADCSLFSEAPGSCKLLLHSQASDFDRASPNWTPNRTCSGLVTTPLSGNPASSSIFLINRPSASLSSVRGVLLAALCVACVAGLWVLVALLIRTRR